jgi:aspartate racemase
LRSCLAEDLVGWTSAVGHELPNGALFRLPIAEAVAAEAVARGCSAWAYWGRVGWSTARSIRRRAGWTCCPTAAERDETDRFIMGDDAVVLGRTEIPLIISDANAPLPTLDSTRLLARAALRRAVWGEADIGRA